MYSVHYMIRVANLQYSLRAVRARRTGHNISNGPRPRKIVLVYYYADNAKSRVIIFDSSKFNYTAGSYIITGQPVIGAMRISVDSLMNISRTVSTFSLVYHFHLFISHTQRNVTTEYIFAKKNKFETI